jgi:hypothetical protein
VTPDTPGTEAPRKPVGRPQKGRGAASEKPKPSKLLIVSFAALAIMVMGMFMAVILQISSIAS